MPAEMLQGTVTLLRRQDGQPPRLEFELRLNSGEKRLVSAREDPAHAIFENQRIVVTGTVDNQSVLQAESIAPMIVPAVPQTPPPPRRSIAPWLLLPPVATAMVLITTVTIQGRTLSREVWLVLATFAIAFAVFRIKRRGVKLVVSGAALAAALTAYNVTPNVTLRDLMNAFGLWVIIFVLLLVLSAVSAIVAVVRLVAQRATRRMSAGPPTPPAPPPN